MTYVIISLARERTETYSLGYQSRAGDLNLTFGLTKSRMETQKPDP